MAIKEQDYYGFALDPVTGERHKLEHLPVMAAWEELIYQLADGDKLTGGVDGCSNLPHQELANRTEFLKVLGSQLLKMIKALERKSDRLLRMTTATDVLTTTVAKEQPVDGSVWISPQGDVNCTANPGVRIVMHGESTPDRHPKMLIVSNNGTVTVATALASREPPAAGTAWICTGIDYPYDAERRSCIVTSDAPTGSRIVSGNGVIPTQGGAQSTIFFSLGTEKKPYGWTGKGTIKNPVAKIITKDGTVTMVTSLIEPLGLQDAVYPGDIFRIVLADGTAICDQNGLIVSDAGKAWNVQTGANGNTAVLEEITQADVDAIFDA